MNTTKKTWLFILVVLALTLSACGGQTAGEAEADGEATVDPSAIFTSAAATVGAQLTETAVSFSPTPAPPTVAPTLPATATPIDIGQTPLASPTGVGGPTATLPAGVPTLTPSVLTLVPTATLDSGDKCDAMLYGSPLDVTIPDGTDFELGGINFYKIWRIQNAGTCTWDSGYKLVPVANSRVLDAANPAWELDTLVSPGETVDVGAHLTSPNSVGEGYETCFMMMNDRGVLFGGYLCAKIDVVDP